MARVHRLQHVEGLARTTLADHDAIGAHTQRVLHQVTDGDLAATFDVRRPGLHREHVLLVKLELLRIFNGDDAFVFGNERRQHVERRRLTGAGAARHDHVELADHARLQEPRRVRRHGAEANQIVDLQRILRELADRQERSADRQRLDDRVHTRTVGKAGIAQRRRLVDTSTDLTDDFVDDAPQM